MYGISFSPESRHSQYRQLVDQLRERITSGYITGGTKLASTRNLASELAIARGVVLEAIDQLRLEGYIETRQGSGAYVREGLVWDSNERGTIEHSSGPERSARPSVVGRPDTREGTSTRSPAELAERAVLSFAPGMPDLSLFPRRQWLSSYHDVIEYAEPIDLAYTRPAGDWELRKEIASYLREIKGINVGSERIIVTAGASQAFGMLCEIIPAAKVAMENPVAPFVRRVFDGHGANVSYVPVDSGGIREDLIPEGRFDYVYVTPSHQFPLGGCLDAARRVALLERARSCGAWVIEDDFDSEFRYDGKPVAPLHVMAPERVAYVGTFSKVLSPALRLGFMILPAGLQSRAKTLKRRWDLWSEGLQQKALRNFIERGHLARHLARTSRLYRKKRDYLISLVDSRLATHWTVTGAETGMHLVLRHHDGAGNAVDVCDVIEALKKKGIEAESVNAYCVSSNDHRDCLIVAYANRTEEELLRLVEELSKIR